MVIVNPHTAGSFDWPPHTLQQIGGLDTRTPEPLEILASAPTRSDL
jgi:hypothetical protein